MREEIALTTYTRAYRLGELRRYSGWRQNPAQSDAGGPTDTQASDGQTVYLRSDFVVLQNCFDESPVLFDAVTPQWVAFCKNTLGFDAPDLEQESHRIGEKR